MLTITGLMYWIIILNLVWYPATLKLPARKACGENPAWTIYSHSSILYWDMEGSLFPKVNMIEEILDKNKTTFSVSQSQLRIIYYDFIDYKKMNIWRSTMKYGGA